ncbi:hypothetical protein GF322_02225 [Candidatus Dependentiae bacterium]|nr:hypothetical protein [Candidatus Dependentiae bacterium]
MIFFKKNLMFLIFFGLMFVPIQKSFAMKRKAEQAGLEDENPHESKVYKVSDEEIRVKTKFEEQFLEVDQYRQKFIDAVEKNDKEILDFFENKKFDFEIDDFQISLNLKKIVFSDLLYNSIHYPKGDDSSWWKKMINFCKGFIRGESKKLILLKDNPFNFIFKKNDQYYYVKDLDYFLINLDFILEYAGALISSENYEHINAIENFLLKNKNVIDANKLSPQLSFIFKAVTDVREEGSDYNNIYKQLKSFLISNSTVLKLKSLNINSKELLEVILSFIENDEKLEILDISLNQLAELPDNIGNLTELQELNVRHNQLTELPDNIGNLPKLKNLNVGDNKLTGLPDSIRNLTGLKILNVRLNQLTRLPDSIGNLTGLKILNVGYNQLTELPDNIGNLTELQELNLFWNNQLTELPDSIGNLTELQDLNVGHNRLTELPDSIGNLIKLQELYLGNNQLTEVPDNIGNLTKLKNLNVGLNQLTGLPDSIGNLTKLKKLNVGDNQLTVLPDNIGNLTKLKKLNVGDNQLTGLPDSIGNLRELQELVLYGNVGLGDNFQVRFDENVIVQAWLRNHFPQ